MESAKALVIIFALFLAATFAPQYLGYEVKVSTTNALLGLLLILGTYVLVTYAGYSELAVTVCAIVGIIVVIANMWGVGTSWILLLGVIGAIGFLTLRASIGRYTGISLLRREYRQEKGIIGELGHEITEEKELIKGEEKIEGKVYQNIEKIEDIRERILEDLRKILNDIKKELKLERRASKEVFYLDKREMKRMRRTGVEELNIDIKTFEDLEKFCIKRVENVLENLITSLQSIETVTKMVGIEARGTYVSGVMKRDIPPANLKKARKDLEELSGRFDEELTREKAYVNQIFRCLRIERRYAKKVGLGGKKRKRILKDIQGRVKDIIKRIDEAGGIFRNAIRKEIKELTKAEVELDKIVREEAKIESKA